MIFREMGAVSYTDRRNGFWNQPAVLSEPVCSGLFWFPRMAEFSLSTSNLSPKKRASFKRFKTFLKIGVAALVHC